MPKFDLAGNPIPEDGPAPRPARPATQPPTAPTPPPAWGAAPGAAAQYDLAGNPVAASGGASAYGAYGASPAGYATPSAGTWPPPPGVGNPYDVARNDSGAKVGFPPEIAVLKWNWGAFALTWLWCLNHGMVGWGIGLLLGGIVVGMVPGGGLLSVAASIYFGIKGHQMGWQNRHFPGGLPQFFDVQRAWMKWGVGLLILNLLMVPILAAILFPFFAKARQNARMHSGYYRQPYGNGNVNGGGGFGGASPNSGP